MDRKWFQFQTGSIRPEATNTGAVTIEGFNSKLVRLEVESQGFAEHHNSRVSIPNWFD